MPLHGVSLFNFISRPHLVRSRLCYSVAFVCLSVVCNFMYCG